MSKYPAYPNAPITEAVLNIEVELSKDFDSKKFNTFFNRIKKDFPIKEERISHMFGFQVSPLDIASSTKSAPDGYMFLSHDRKKVVQVRSNGFSFHKLKPYQDWTMLSSEAQKIWDIYIETIKPVSIKKIALRYINRIEIPLPLEGELQDYIFTIPVMPSAIPFRLNGFFIQTIIENISDNSIKGLLTQTIAATNSIINQKSLPFILDIDVSKEKIYNNINILEIWEDFNNLHNLKNKVFFETITHKTKELFK